MKVLLCLQNDFAGIIAKSEILVNPASWEVFFVIANDMKKKSLQQKAAKPAPVLYRA